MFILNDKLMFNNTLCYDNFDDYDFLKLWNVLSLKMKLDQTFFFSFSFKCENLKVMKNGKLL
jgi:hypothetical protein